MSSTTTPLRRSRRLASASPLPEGEPGLLPSLSPSFPPIHRQLLKSPARAPKRAQGPGAAAAAATSSTIDTILRGDRAGLARLTKADLIAVVGALADRATTSQRHVEALEKDLGRAESTTAANTMKKGQQSMKMREIMRMHGGAKPAEEAAAPAPAPPAPADPAPSPPPTTPAAAPAASPAEEVPASLWRSFTNMFTTPFSRKRVAEDEPASPAPSQKRQKPIEPAPAAEKQQATTPARESTEQPTPAPAPIEPPSTAPAPPATMKPMATPTPKRKRTAGTTAAATPLPAIPESSPQQNAPITPRPRTIASARAAKSASKAAQQTDRPWAWEKKPRVKEPNADTRLAKIRQADFYRRKLAELEKDEEVLRKVKRVKVDHLAEIPHNRPGDPSSCFRVPDIDSDDEMEVDEDVEERRNIFSASQPPAPQAETPAPPQLPAQQVTSPLPPTPQLPAQQATSSLLPTPQLPAQQTSSPHPPTPAQEQQTPRPAPQRFNFPSVTPKPADQTRRPQPPRFSFPSVAPKPADYSVTPAYTEACRNLFAAGLAAY